MKTKLFKSMAIAIMMFTIYACSENEDSIVPQTAMSVVQTTINDSKNNTYLLLDSIPEDMAKEMDAEELSIWKKLCSRYYIKKNAFYSDYYKNHKTAVLKRFETLYNYSLKKGLDPINLSFIWADKEDIVKNANQPLSYSYNFSDSTETDAPIASDSTDISSNTTYGTAYLSYDVDTRYYYMITVSANYKVTNNGYTKYYEQTSDTQTNLFPTLAYLEMGNCYMSIDEEGIVFVLIYGTFKCGTYSKFINFNQLTDICELLPQC